MTVNSRFETELTVKDEVIYEYKYCNLNNSDEEYLVIYMGATWFKYSYVTFKAANIPDALVMVVNTTQPPIFRHKFKRVYLPRSVDEWEIKYYSRWGSLKAPEPNYLKNACVVNLNEYFKGQDKNGLYIELSAGQFIGNIPGGTRNMYYSIPSV